MLTYVIIEDTRGPFTEEDKKLEPLCFLDDEDINELLMYLEFISYQMNL